MKNAKPRKLIESLQVVPAATARTAAVAKINGIFPTATFQLMLVAVISLFCAAPVIQAQDAMRTRSASLVANQINDQDKITEQIATAALNEPNELDEALSLLADDVPEKFFDKLKNQWKDYDYTVTQIETFKKQLPPKLRLLDAADPLSVRANRIAKKAFDEFGLLNRSVQVYESEMPLVSLWKGYCVLVSRAALDVLSDAEILALTAHELGHLYFMDELRTAIENKNFRTMRVIELKCDLISMMCLLNLKLPLGSAVDAFSKMTERGLKLKRITDSSSHPDVRERQKFYEKAKTRLKR